MTDHASARPPRWAESLLRLLLRPEDRDSVSGDLVEEYRQSIVPARGTGWAHAWYVRQVGWYALRASWPFGVLVGATLVVRYVFDTLDPVRYTPGVVHPRSRIMSQMLVGILALSALRGAWRTTHLRAGVLIAVVTAVIGGVISVIGTVALLAIWHDPATLTAWDTSGGLDEALVGVPMLMIPIALVSGTVGAIAGKCVSWPLKRRQV